jgi:hypothetical protein
MIDPPLWTFTPHLTDSSLVGWLGYLHELTCLPCSAMGEESNRRQIISFLSGLVLYLALSYTGSVRRTYRSKKHRPLPYAW